MRSSVGFRVRRLGAADVAALRRLLRVLGEAFEDIESYSAAQPDDAYLAALLADETVVVLAAYVDGDVVGGLIAYELRKFERPRSEFYIYDLAVLADQRRKGIATGLIDALKPIARSRGGCVIFVQADVVDEPAVALYESVGVREDGVYHFDISVGTGE